MSKTLGDRQRRILGFITEKQQEGWTPSVREIADAVGLHSSAAVQKHLDSLERNGYIRRLPGKARLIQVLKPLSRTGEQLLIPIVGEVAAGLPILAEENIAGYLTAVNEEVLARGGTFFALKVKGESMIDAGILPGDHVVVRQQATAENGEIVVALVEEEATVKRFFKENDHIRLQPENIQMEPIRMRTVQILGKVVSVVRQM
ncbi:MAG: repressor LexA [Chloroflexi bacterium]|nr:MAG: repressor LexA [Chloroflexota bacterium]